MRNGATIRMLFPPRIAVLVLASVFAFPAVAQQGQPAGEPQNSPSSVVQPQPDSPASQLNTSPKEGFWGHLNPFARKKWVNKRVDPLKDRVSELGEVDAKNARDIQDVDARAQAGIHNAKSAADAANHSQDLKKLATGHCRQGARNHVGVLLP